MNMSMGFQNGLNMRQVCVLICLLFGSCMDDAQETKVCVKDNVVKLGKTILRGKFTK